MRNAPGQTTGYILVPLYLDQGERDPSGSWSKSESLVSAWSAPRKRIQAL
jgi:hypothetical protein